MKKTNFFILGAPKCGTTSMYYWLTQHNQIFFPQQKEIHFFSDDLHSKKRVVTDINNYLNHYSTVKNCQKIIGEASVFYLYSNNAVDNILDFNPNSKFLVMLRNPIEMVLSLHKQYLYSGNEIYSNFEKAWKLRKKRIEGVGITNVTEDPQLLDYGKVCKLGEQVERLLNKVEAQNVHFVLLEDLKLNTYEEVKKIYRFLDIDDNDINFQVYNVAAIRKYPRLHRVIKYIINKKRESIVGDINFHLNPFVKHLNKKYNRKVASEFLYSKELMYEIKNFFYEDILLLEKIIDRECYSKKIKI